MPAPPSLNTTVAPAFPATAIAIQPASALASLSSRAAIAATAASTTGHAAPSPTAPAASAASAASPPAGASKFAADWAAACSDAGCTW